MKGYHLVKKWKLEIKKQDTFQKSEGNQHQPQGFHTTYKNWLFFLYPKWTHGVKNKVGEILSSNNIISTLFQPPVSTSILRTIWFVYRNVRTLVLIQNTKKHLWQSVIFGKFAGHKSLHFERRLLVPNH